MEEFNIVPMYQQGMNELINGIDIPVPTFCAKNCMGKGNTNNKCEEYYKYILSKGEGIYVCPYGFNSSVFLVGDTVNVFSCLQIEGKYEKKKVAPKIEQDKNRKKQRIISEEMLNTYQNAYVEYYLNTVKYEKHKQFVENIFHDIRKYNCQLQLKSNNIYKKAESSRQNRKDYMENAKSIREICWFFTMRMSAYDFSYDEELMTAAPKTNYNLFRCFDKVRKCISDKAREKDVKIKLDACTECSDGEAYECIELLPFLLLDNAVKYALPGSGIAVKFEEREGVLAINVISVGPCLQEEEKEKLFMRGFRGEQAQMATADGLGIGLYTARKICGIHNIKIEICSSDKVQKEVNNIGYSEFRVDIWQKIL